MTDDQFLRATLVINQPVFGNPWLGLNVPCDNVTAVIDPHTHIHHTHTHVYIKIYIYIY